MSERIVLKHFIFITLVTINLLFSSLPSQAEGVEGEAVLCKRRNLLTAIALSTKKYNVAVCFDASTDKGYYIGQSKTDNSSIFLPLKYQYDSSSGTTLPLEIESEGYIYKAVNGQYTYQVFLKKNYTCGSGEWASLTVFKNGSRIYHEKVNNFLSTSNC